MRNLFVQIRIVFSTIGTLLKVKEACPKIVSGTSQPREVRREKNRTPGEKDRRKNQSRRNPGSENLTSLSGIHAPL